MSQLQLSGLASGFDWKSVVDQLIQLQRVPQTRLQTEKTLNSTQLNGFSSFRTLLTDLQSSVNTLTSDSLFNKRDFSLADDDSDWSGTASNGATEGTYVFDLTQLATKSVRQGASGIATSINDSDDVSSLVVSEMRLGTAVTAGTFSVNGQKVEVATTDTLQDVFDKISTATSGDVTASYDSDTDMVTLSSSGAISLGSGSDTSNFLYALKLYNSGGTSVSSATSLGTVALSDGIASSGLGSSITSVDGNGDGSFVINGETIDFNVNDDTLQDIINRVNESDAGVTMSYDEVNDRFTLSNDKTGNLDVSVSESSGGILEALGLNSTSSLTRGENAEFTLGGGGTIVTSSNVLDESVHGITGLSVTATSLGQQTITIGSDTAEIDAGIREFIKKYNAVQKFVDDRTKVTTNPDGSVTTAVFSGNREITDIARNLRTRVFDEVSGLSGTLKRLEGMGIDFEGNSSQLAVRDEAKFSAAISDNLAEVADIFTTASTGLSAKLDDYVDGLLATGGTLDTQEDTLEKKNSNLDKQIADIERRLAAERTRLEGSFIRMEEAQSRMNSQLASLESILGFPS